MSVRRDIGQDWVGSVRFLAIRVSIMSKNCPEMRTAPPHPQPLYFFSWLQLSEACAKNTHSPVMKIPPTETALFSYRSKLVVGPTKRQI